MYPRSSGRGGYGYDGRGLPPPPPAYQTGHPAESVKYLVDYGPRANYSSTRRSVGSDRPPPRDEREREVAPSRHLWVGNVTPEMTEDMLLEKFKIFGKVEGVAVYASKQYAFVNFKTTEDAQAAKTKLQGTSIAGITIRIEFARPAQPSRKLWAGSVPKVLDADSLRKEFERFGKLEDFKFLRERNCAFIDYENLEDAIKAVDGLNGKVFGDEELWVDYGRSYPAKAASFRGTSSAAAIPRSRHVSDKSEEICRCLWVGFPVDSKVDDRLLREAFERYGELDRVKSFPGRTYAFVQFLDVESAVKAKDQMDDRLFNGYKFVVKFSRSEIMVYDRERELIDERGEKRDHRSYGREERDGRGQFGWDRGGPHDTDPHGLHPLYEVRDRLGRPMDAHHMDAMPERMGAPGVEFFEGRRAREQCPPPPMGGGRMPVEFGEWSEAVERDGREIKRPRFGPGDFGSGALQPGESMEDVRSRFISRDFPTAGPGPDARPERDFPGPPPPLSGLTSLPMPVASDSARGAHQMVEPAGPRVGPGLVQAHENGGHAESQVWFGTIAKGGAPVCRARSFPIDKGIDVSLPDIVNCTARTDLETLAKHIHSAPGFGVVGFVPEREADVGPYQDFMQYLGEKQRAGVAKCEDGTTLFLVPPSQFSETVLKMRPSDFLFGVVLKFHSGTGATSAPGLGGLAVVEAGRQGSRLLPPAIAQAMGGGSSSGFARPPVGHPWPVAANPQGAGGPQPSQQIPPPFGNTQVPGPSSTTPGPFVERAPPQQHQQSMQGPPEAQQGPHVNHTQFTQPPPQQPAAASAPPQQAPPRQLVELPPGLTPELLASLSALLPQMQAQQMQQAQQQMQVGSAVGSSNAPTAPPVGMPFGHVQSSRPAALSAPGQFHSDASLPSSAAGPSSSVPMALRAFGQALSQQMAAGAGGGVPALPVATSAPPTGPASQPQTMFGQPAQGLQALQQLAMGGAGASQLYGARGNVSEKPPPQQQYPQQQVGAPQQHQSIPTSLPQILPEELAQLTALLVQRPIQQQQQQQSQAPPAQLVPHTQAPQSHSQFHQQLSALQWQTQPPPQHQHHHHTSGSKQQPHQQQQQQTLPPPAPSQPQLAASMQQPSSGNWDPGSSAQSQQTQADANGSDADRQKKFQATLQLAAALLQQMQQQHQPQRNGPQG